MKSLKISSLLALLLLSGCYTKQEMEYYNDAAFKVGYSQGKMEADKKCKEKYEPSQVP